MLVSESYVRTKLAPYEGRIRMAIDKAWKDYLGIPCRHKFLFPRTRANIVFDLIAGEMKSEFDSSPAVQIIHRNETIQFLIEDELLFRIKKANRVGLGSNIQTQQVLDFICQEPELPGLLGERHKIEIIYFEDPTGAEVASVHVTARDFDVKLWSYEMDSGEAAEGAAIITFPSMPSDPLPPEVVPKADEEEGRSKGE